MSYTQLPWENRVFRIDRECYMLFLGIDELDVKPFVRIGNSSCLDERILEVISHTVITESFTGNPFGEVGLTHDYNGRYLGEPKIVEVIKSFFNRFHVTDSEVISYSEQEEREGRDHVYFYNTGNIVVNFGDTRLFDLYAREKSDRHYNYYCSEILSIYRKNPLKWEPGSIRGKGLFRVDDNLFFFDGGKLLGLTWDRHYFKKLAQAGWDPDKLEGILVNLKPEEMEGDKSAGVMNFIKRGIAARNPMTFFSRDKSFSDKIEPLFEYVQSRDVPIQFCDISSRGKFDWNDTAGEWNNGAFSFKLADDVEVRIDEMGKTTLLFGGKKRDFSLGESIPTRIFSEKLDLGKLKNIYIDGVSKAIIYSDLIGDEVRFVREATQVVQSLFDGINKGKANLTVPQEKSFDDMKDLIGSAGKSDDKRIALFGSNCAVFLDLLSKEKGPLASKAAKAASLLRGKIIAPDRQAVSFLFVADCYREGCFYLPFKVDISSGDKARSQEMHEALIKCDKKEVDFFFSERKRLDALLAALNEGTLWRDMKKHEEAKAAAVQKKTSSSTTSTQPAKKKSPMSSPPAKESSRPVSSSKKGATRNGGSGKRWYLLLLLLLLPLLAGLGFLGYRYLSGDNSSISEFLSNEADHVFHDTAGGQKSNDSINESGLGPDGVNALVGGPNGSVDSSTQEVGDNMLSEHEVGDNALSSQEVGENTLSNQEVGETISPDNGGAKTILTGEEEVPDSSPLSESDSVVILSDDGLGDPRVVIKDTEDTLVRKPFVPDDSFIESFTIGGIQITMADIHLKANAIAVMNGYRDLGFHIVDGADPTIIEPGQELKIPGNLIYMVQSADNIWYIGARLLESEMRENTKRFEELKIQYKNAEDQGLEGTNSLITEMNRLIEGSNCENFKIAVQRWLDER
jgi:hypothetical protein